MFTSRLRSILWPLIGSVLIGIFYSFFYSSSRTHFISRVYAVARESCYPEDLDVLAKVYWAHYFDDWKDVTDREDVANISVSVAVFNGLPLMQHLFEGKQEYETGEFTPFYQGNLS